MSYYQKKIPDLSIKSNAQKAHARRRIKQRIGDLDSEKIGRIIRQGKSKFLSRESNRISHHIVEIEGKPFEVVYDRRTSNVVTVLFLEENTV